LRCLLSHFVLAKTGPLCVLRSTATAHQLHRPVDEENSEVDRMMASTSALLDTDADVASVHVRGRHSKPSLLRVLARVFGPMLFWAHLCKLAADCLIFLGPLLQRSACPLSTLSHLH